MAVKSRRIMMISTHGYVAAEPELGRSDTGGQVVYVLELSRCLGRMGYQVDICTRQFEDQPAEEAVDDRVRILRFPCGGNEFIRKEVLCEHIPEWVTNVHRFTSSRRLNVRSSTATTGMPVLRGRRWRIAGTFRICTRRTRSARGSAPT